MKRLFFWACVATAGALVGLIGVVGIFGHGLGRPVRWELPVGYRGWAVLFYEQPQCAPLIRYDPGSTSWFDSTVTAEPVPQNRNCEDGAITATNTFSEMDRGSYTGKSRLVERADLSGA